MTADPRRRGRWRGSGTLAAPTAAGPEAAAPAPAAGAVPAPVVGLASRPAARRVAAWRRPGPERAPGPAAPAAAAGRRERAEGPAEAAGRATSEWTRPTGCGATARAQGRRPSRPPWMMDNSCVLLVFVGLQHMVLAWTIAALFSILDFPL